MIDVRKCLCVRSYADDVQCYFSFDRDSSVDMIKNKIQAHKCLNGYAPTYLKILINSRSVSARYTLRVNDDNWRLQMVTSLNFGRSQSMFLYASPKVWNSLPPFLRKIETLYLFKKRLKAYYSRTPIIRTPIIRNAYYPNTTSTKVIRSMTILTTLANLKQTK